jgi:hypothetical protein
MLNNARDIVIKRGVQFFYCRFAAAKTLAGLDGLTAQF